MVPNGTPAASMGTTMYCAAPANTSTLAATANHQAPPAWSAPARTGVGWGGGSTLALVPATGLVHHTLLQQHDRHRDQHPNHRGQRGPRLEPKKTDGGGHRQFKEVRRPDQRR